MCGGLGQALMSAKANRINASPRGKAAQYYPETAVHRRSLRSDIPPQTGQISDHPETVGTRAVLS